MLTSNLGFHDCCTEDPEEEDSREVSEGGQSGLWCEINTLSDGARGGTERRLYE
jgi:hypothetical protein